MLKGKLKRTKLRMEIATDILGFCYENSSGSSGPCRRVGAGCGMMPTHIGERIALEALFCKQNTLAL